MVRQCNIEITHDLHKPAHPVGGPTYMDTDLFVAKRYLINSISPWSRTPLTDHPYYCIDRHK